MKNKKMIFLVLLLIIFICIMGYSVYNIIVWKIDNNTTESITNTIMEKVEVIEQEDSTIVVDYEPIQPTNDEVVGWLKVNGTKINHPVVKHKDNDYYLTHSFDKSYNRAGWIFMDYRNSGDVLDKNNIIYGHNRKDGNMFGGLKKILDDSSFRQNKNNLIINYNTLTDNYLFQIFSIYIISDTADYISINPSQELIDEFIKRSAHDFGVSVTTDDTLLTLQTCRNSESKLVVHAKLIQN